MSPNALDSAFRLRPGQWLDVQIAVDDGPLFVPAAYLNVWALATATGWASVYPPGPFPGTTTIALVANQPTASGTFVATSIVRGRYAVRVYTSVLTHIVIDLTGVTIKGRGTLPAAQAQGQSGEGARSSKGNKGPSQGRRTRLVERFLSRLSR